MALSDGTPGSDGVLVSDQYDPRFDITTDEFEPFGFIYLITNQVNGKQYVGQTCMTIKRRWYDHTKNARLYLTRKNTKRKTPLIDTIIAKYGKENFIVEEIECCLVAVLDEREIYWIRRYDCCILDGEEKGYNVSRGGKGNRQYLLDEKKIIDLYEDGLSFPQLAKIFGTSSRTIKDIISKNGHELRTQNEVKELMRLRYNYKVSALDDNGNIVRSFDSQAHAGDWVVEQGLTKSTSAGARKNIRASFLLNHRAYGYHWIIEGMDEDELEEQHARIKNAKQCSEQNRKKKKKKKEPSVSVRTEKTAKTCVYEGCSNLVFKRSKYCEMHFGGPEQKSNKPEDLTKLILMICETSFTEASKFYNVSDNTLRKWLKSEGIPVKIKELKEYARTNKLIGDPTDSFPHAEIYERVKRTGGIQSTAYKFHCSKEIVVECCFRHGMTKDELAELNSKARDLGKPKCIAQCDSKGNIIRIFNTIHEASRATGDSRIHITEECKGNRISRWHWRFLD